jgi:peroxiredoxin
MTFSAVAQDAAEQRQRPRRMRADDGSTTGPGTGVRRGRGMMDPESTGAMRRGMAPGMQEGSTTAMRERMRQRPGTDPASDAAGAERSTLRQGETASTAATGAAATPAAGGGAAGASYAGTSQAPVSVGTPVQDFHATDASGQQVSLSQHRGKIVVLEWTNPECPYVKRHDQKGTMKQLAQKYAGQDVVWLAVDSTNTNTPEKSAAWQKSQNLPYPILVDRDGSLARAFGAKTTPHMFVIDKEGRLAYQGAIDDDPGGNNQNPRNYVDEALAKLNAGEQPEMTNTQPYGCGVKYAQ